MSNRYDFTVVYAMDQLGERYCIYDCDHYAGGCEYKTMITVEDQQYEVRAYPLENREEVTGDKLPQLTPEDLKSYFTSEPTAAIGQVLKICKLEDMQFAQLVMVIEHSVAAGIYEAECIHVTADGVEHTCYEDDALVGDDAWSIADNIADEAWYSYHRKRGDLTDDDGL